MTAPARETDWNEEWQIAWKAHADNAWFAYQAAEYARSLAAAPLPRHARVLKTDAFDEACGFRPLPASFLDGATVVHMDIAQRVLTAARMRSSDVRLAHATDVRRLACKPGSLDLVFSPSSLDHFGDARDIWRALAELRHALRPGGRLLITLDNPWNPVLRARQAVVRAIGPIGGVIPFQMGVTLSRRRLVTLLEEAGFEVTRSDWVVHMSRLLGLWLGEWAARRGEPAWSARLREAFTLVDRLAHHLPTRALTGHFVLADCRSLGPTAGAAAVPAGLLPASRLERVVLGLRNAEHRLRSTYIRLTPASVQRRVDPPLRRCLAGARRLVALPLYIRQPLTLWTGPCDGEPARVLVWGKASGPRRLFQIIFDEPPSPAAVSRWTLAEALDPTRGERAGADVFMAETTPLLADAFRRRGFLIVPPHVRYGGDPAAMLASLATPSRSLRSDLRLVARGGFRIERWPYDRARCLLFHHRYLLPHARTRFAEHANPPAFAWLVDSYRAGHALAVFAPGGTEPDAIGIVVWRGATLWFPHLGTRDGDPSIARSGALTALYDAIIRTATAAGARSVDFGRCAPWRRDGVGAYKWKWGLRPTADLTQTQEDAVAPLRPESAAVRRLVDHGIFTRERRGFRMLTAEGLVNV